MRRGDLSPTSGDEGSMVTAPIYHNVGGDYPRRPPPPVPGVSEDAPPALPPRRFNSSKSESFLLARMDQSQRDGLKDTFAQDAVAPPSGTRGWEGGGTGTLKEDAYAQQLRKQARRFSEQHKPVGISMQVVSTKSTVQVSLSQSYKQEQASAMEVKPVMRVSPQTSPSHMEVKTSAMLLQSPPMSRGRATPEPPPMPTPMKNGETEVPSDLNKTADFPPPPTEFTEGAETSKEHSDRCADDSYGYYKTRSPREVGKYKRTTSDTSLLRTRQEPKTFQPHPDLDSKDVAETPNKPPRKKLEGRDSPNLGLRSNSPSMLNGDRKVTDQRVPPLIPSFKSAEVTSVQHAVKSVAKPLSNVSVQKINSPTSMSTSLGSFVDTVVQRPGDRNSLSEESLEQRRSVKDRVKNIEVFAHSPGSSQGSQRSPNNGQTVKAFSDEKKDSSFDSHTSDSLEQLESSAIQSDNLKDRLRPVVKKAETPSGQPESLVPHRSSVDAADHATVTATPPAVPHRTYKQQSGSSSATYRRDSFQNRGPKPYENKENSSANIHNPLNQNHIINTSRSPGQSVPEPQVPSRSSKPRYPPTGGDHLTRDQNSNVSSPELSLRVIPNHSDKESVQNKDNTLVNSVQSGQKRNYESSFSSRTRSGSSSGNSDHQNVATFHNRSHSDKQQGDKTPPQRQDHKGDHHHSEQRQSHDLRLPQGHSKNSPSSSQSGRHPTPDQSHSDNRNTQRHNNNTSMNNKNNSNESSHQIHHHKDNKRDQSKHTTPHTTPHREVVRDHLPAAPQASPLVTVNHGRQPSAEELECDKKAKELAKVLQESDKALSEVLQTDSKKNRMQFLDGILPVEQTGEERRPRSGTKKEEKSSEAETEKEPTSPMPSNYYVSPPKAMIELEIRKLSDNNQLTHDIADNDTLAQKKEELLQRMMKKVEVLKDDKKELLTDIDENEALGKQLIEHVESKSRSQQEKDKYRSYIEDIDKIIRLLLKLSGLLARAENTIQGLSENTNEKIRKMTFDKRDRLYQQHEDAKQLKTDIDRRSDQVETILQSCLATNELDDYHYYIKMKSKYTIQLQELEDKITLGNEQIAALQKSIPNKK